MTVLGYFQGRSVVFKDASKIDFCGSLRNAHSTIKPEASMGRSHFSGLNDTKHFGKRGTAFKQQTRLIWRTPVVQRIQDVAYPEVFLDVGRYSIEALRTCIEYVATFLGVTTEERRQRLVHAAIPTGV